MSRILNSRQPAGAAHADFCTLIHNWKDGKVSLSVSKGGFCTQLMMTPQEAEAEIERAKGVAAANKIIGDSLAGNEAYLRYLWVQGLQSNQLQVVYVPTEANLPILESTRLSHMLPKVVK